MIRYLYLIDGVAVPKHIYERRQIFGEHKAAIFRVVEVRGNPVTR